MFATVVALKSDMLQRVYCFFHSPRAKSSSELSIMLRNILMASRGIFTTLTVIRIFCYLYIDLRNFQNCQTQVSKLVCSAIAVAVLMASEQARLSLSVLN